jgi:hypothetical protein
VPNNPSARPARQEPLGRDRRRCSAKQNTPGTRHAHARTHSRRLAARHGVPAATARALTRCACARALPPLSLHQVWQNGKKMEELVGANKDNLERMAAKFV